MPGNESYTHIKPGVTVEVINGMAKGCVGVVAKPWPRHYVKGIPLWLVMFSGLERQRVLRQDYLRVCP